MAAAAMASQAPTKLPKGILPAGITVPPGTDIMQFCRDLAESGADFAEQFDRENPRYHNGITTEVPLGGGRIPESMPEAHPKLEKDPLDWRALPDAPLAIENDFGEDYNKAMSYYTRLNDCKKAISVLNKPVEMVMKLRVQYKDNLNAENETDTAWKSRLKGAENERDGAIAAALVTIWDMDPTILSERTRACVKEVETRGKFDFVDKETYGEYMQVLQAANQAIFMDQKKLLAKIKEAKRIAKGEKAPAKYSDECVKGGYAAATKVPVAVASLSGA